MTQPHSYLIRMVLFLIAVGAAAAALWPPLSEAFLANPAINALIGGVLLIGILYTFGRVVSLRPEVTWVNSFRRADPGLSPPKRTRLLAPMAALLRERSGPMTLTTLATRSILDSIGARLDESRDISRYLIGLLIFLGLLGTFWGLLDTVSAVGTTISTLNIAGGPSEQVFEELRQGLEAPLAGMGTAFSSSLFGLAGSLVVGFLDLQAAQAQNRFYNDLEEWLSTVTQLTPGSAFSGDEDTTTPGYVGALLERTAETLMGLQQAAIRAEDARANAESNLRELATRVGALTDVMRGEQARLAELARQQGDLRGALENLIHHLETGPSAFPPEMAEHLRSLDTAVTRLSEEAAQTRTQTLGDLRFELKLLRKTLANVAAGEPPDAGIES